MSVSETIRSGVIRLNLQLQKGAWALGLCVFWGNVIPARAAPTWEQTVPVLERVCWECHDDTLQDGEVDLSRFDTEGDAMAEYPLWQKVQQMVANSEMPPPDKKTQPSESERALLLDWIDAALDRVARADAGDPGRVTLRRLTNTEYDNTIGDLTGLDLGLSKRFAKDPGGGEGFTNTGDTLFLSPEALEKYLQSAREVAVRVSAMPGTGIEFREEPVNLRGVSSLRSELSVKLRNEYEPRLEQFIPDKFEELEMGTYLLACWEHKQGLGELAELSKKHELEPAFLDNWWRFLDNDSSNPFLNRIRIPWLELPGRDHLNAVKAGISKIVAEQEIEMNNSELPAAATLEGDENRFILTVADMGDGNRGDYISWKEFKIGFGIDSNGNEKRVWLFDWIEEQIPQYEKLIKEGKEDAREAERELKNLRSILQWVGTAPDGIDPVEKGFVVQAPSRIEIRLPGKVRSMSASPGVISGRPDSEFTTVQAMIYGANAEKMPEFPPILPAVRGKYADSGEIRNNFLRNIQIRNRVFPKSRTGRLGETDFHLSRRKPPSGVYYLSHQQLSERLPEDERTLPARFSEDYHLTYLNSRDQLQEKHFAIWDQLLQAHLAEFAEQAYRRPLSEAEAGALVAGYATAVQETGNREEAAREVIVRILISPSFLFKAEPARSDLPESPLDDWAFASRLSYFLWSTMPDKSLFEAASDGSIRQPDVLEKQIDRMLKHPKAMALATEFAGQWLGFRDFHEHTPIDRELFPAFTDELRDSMAREVTLFFADLVTHDLPVTDILHGNYTYLNQELADHYGIVGFSPAPEAGRGLTRWEVPEPRGGILGMGAILAGTAFPDRASPVRRGNWIQRTVLGYDTPPVPADVPELESDGLVGKLPLRERLEKHRDSKSCRGCHSRIDPPGFALQNFDAIGRWREVDTEGEPIDASATLLNGTQFSGPTGLKQHLSEQKSDFLRQFCTKLLGYALGREGLITDRPLLEQMETEMKNDDDRFSNAVRAIVKSRQFQNRKNL